MDKLLLLTISLAMMGCAGDLYVRSTEPYTVETSTYEDEDGYYPYYRQPSLQVYPSVLVYHSRTINYNRKPYHTYYRHF